MLADRLAPFAALAGHRPWPRHAVDPATWTALGQDLAAGGLDLLGLWAERDAVHMALREPGTGALAVASLACPDGRFPSIGRVHPPAIRLERTIRDLFGLEPEGATDTRPWLDHGTWPHATPLGAAGGPGGGAAPGAYGFLPTEGEGLHRIPVGPIHAGIIEPGHFRFTAQGETVVRLEARLGFLHKGIEHLLEGADAARAARIVGRVSGDATVAYAIAFARALEAATGTVPPPRAVWLRALLLELERLASHLHDVGFVCNDAAFALLHNRTGILRERLYAMNGALFGHRLLMDTVVPGGVAADLHAPGFAAIRALAAEIGGALPQIARIYDETPSLMDRTATTGITDPALVRRYAAGGHVGRAAGRDFDARRDLAFPPYDVLSPRIVVHGRGDVDARVRVRLEEIEVSLGLIALILERLPLGPLAAPLEAGEGEGMAIVESWRGDVLVWLRAGEGGRILRCHPRDPSWFQWPLLEAAIEGNIVADFPLCNKSFDCSYSGVDL